VLSFAGTGREHPVEPEWVRDGNLNGIRSGRPDDPRKVSSVILDGVRRGFFAATQSDPFMELS